MVQHRQSRNHKSRKYQRAGRPTPTCQAETHLSKILVYFYNKIEIN
jgi:hypothetical protein